MIINVLRSSREVLFLLILYLYFTFYILTHYIIQEMWTRSRNFTALPIVYYSPFKLQPEDGLMKAETS